MPGRPFAERFTLWKSTSPNTQSTVYCQRTVNLLILPRKPSPLHGRCLTGASNTRKQQQTSTQLTYFTSSPFYISKTSLSSCFRNHGKGCNSQQVFQNLTLGRSSLSSLDHKQGNSRRCCA